MTAGDALASARDALATAGVETPRLDAQLLLAWILSCRREDLARAPERLLTERETLIFEKAVSLRALRRPLPYITGEQFFYGRSFKINRAVLIPRPETELLVQTALTHLAGDSTIADIGTGSGCIAVTLALELPEAQVYATDISKDALTLARKNVVRYGMLERVTLLRGDLLEPLPQGLKFDAIVSNPPYIAEHEMPDLQPEVRDYEPNLALTGEPNATGPDGAALYPRLFHDARAHLKPGGWIMVEIGQGQAETVMAAARGFGFKHVVAYDDLGDIARVVVGKWE